MDGVVNNYDTGTGMTVEQMNMLEEVEVKAKRPFPYKFFFFLGVFMLGVYLYQKYRK